MLLARACFFFLLVPIFLMGQEVTEEIRTVGCPGVGQVESEAPPDGSREFIVPQSLRGQLAYYYMAGGTGLLGKRGWRCLVVVGSSGMSLYLAPTEQGLLELAENRKRGSKESLGFVLAQIHTGTSGRYIAARVLARMFPHAHGWVRQLVRDEPEQNLQYVFKPFPADRLKYLDSHCVLFETPPYEEGIGNELGGFPPGSKPVRGVVVDQSAKEEMVKVLAGRLAVEDQAVLDAAIQQLLRELHLETACK